MKLVKLNSTQFDKFASTHRYRSLYQSSMYAKLMVKAGNHIQFLGIVNDKNKLVGATLLLYKDIFMGNKVAYAPRGILFNYEDPESIKELSNKLKTILGKQGYMLLKIDPYIPLSIRDSNGGMMNINSNGNTIIENLKKAGFSYKGKNLFFEGEKPRWESLVLLQRDIREISARLEKKTRGKIKRAANSGAEVVKDNEKDITKLYSFVKGKEKKPQSYFSNICEIFEDNVDVYYVRINTESFLVNSKRNYSKELEFNDALNDKIQSLSIADEEKEEYINKKMESDKLLASYKESLIKSTELLKNNPEGIFIAGALIVKYDNAAYVIAEGMNEKYSYLYPTYLLKWQLINIYNEEGLKYINLGGISGEFEKETQYTPINESKLGFNSTVTEYIGEFEMILNSFSYNLYKKMYK